MLEVLYEDEQYKVMYGSAKKGCSAIERRPQLLAIDKTTGQKMSFLDLPFEIGFKVNKAMENRNNGNK
jgi:hypothetical protein